MIITLKGADFSGAGNNIGNLSQIGGTFTFTINPTPSDATVKINGTARKSITGAYGTAISWEVSKNGYNTRTGSLTMPLGGKTMSVSLTAVGSTTPPVDPEEPGTGGGSGDTPTYIETTIGTTSYATKIVPSWEDVDLTINGIISTSGGSNCTVSKSSPGRCSNIDFVLQVNGGETISFTPTALVNSWALTEFKDTPLTKTNFTPNGDASKSWLTSGATLQSATKYIILNFKKEGSGDFTKENVADIKNTITIN